MPIQIYTEDIISVNRLNTQDLIDNTNDLYQLREYIQLKRVK